MVAEKVSTQVVNKKRGRTSGVPNWTPLENAALLLCGLQTFEEKQQQDNVGMEQRIGELFTSWVRKVATDEEYTSGFKCQFDVKPNGNQGMWTIDALCAARVAAGHLLRRCKDQVLRYVVNVCQVGYNEFCGPDGKLPSGKTTEDALAFVKEFCWQKDLEEQELQKSKRLAKLARTTTTPTPATAPAPFPNEPQDGSVPHASCLFGSNEFDSCIDPELAGSPSPAPTQTYPGDLVYDGGPYYLAWWITGALLNTSATIIIP